MGNEKSKKLLILEKILRFMAVVVLKKYKPKIIGITGSVGKTSTKEAIYWVLASRFRTRRSEKNYNNEIGLPLTIIGSETRGRSLKGWLSVFIKWLGIVLFPIKYPEILILEMGADRPGDISYLTSFVKPQIGILTDISSSHLEFFKTLEGVLKEKSILIKNISENGLAVLNIDNNYISKFKSQSDNPKKTFRISTYGFSETADVVASDLSFNYSSGERKEIKGVTFKLSYRGSTLPMRLNHILAKSHIYIALAAVCVGLEFDLNLVDISQSLEDFTLPSGRMALVSGIKGTMLIDDTYNASPVSTTSALELMEKIEAPRKIAVLGDMLELGEDTEPGHKKVAEKFLEIQGDIFIGVGKRMNFAIEEFKKRNVESERFFHFSSPIEAGRKLQEMLKEGDLVLVKGSQGMRMEKIVEEVMAEPQKAAEILCRQSNDWKKKPWKEV
jgi:UDP-N-acetylmuramoyl-tripeptide--D-alanyl-D-alanine ligase